MHETLARVAQYAEQAVSPAAMTGITMLVDGRARTAVFTDDTAPEIDSAQYETGIGSCLDALRHQQVFVVHDFSTDDRWPPFAEAALAHGIGSSLPMPLVANREGVGALNFYAQVPKPSPTPRWTSPRSSVSRRPSCWPTPGVLGRPPAQPEPVHRPAVPGGIEQAKHISMGMQRCGADEAFQILVRASQRENRKLRDIAEELVSRSAQGGRPPVVRRGGMTEGSNAHVE